jgi:trk system potassium uptake protein TrkH
MSLNALREKANIRLYESKDKVMKYLNVVGALVTLIAISSLIGYHGFFVTEQTEFWLMTAIRASFSFYIVGYIIRFIYDFSPIEYLKRNWLEGILMLLIVFDVIFSLFGSPLIKMIGDIFGFNKLEGFYILFVQAYFVIIIGIEIGKASLGLPILKFNPSTLMLMSFVLLILIGTSLLMLPTMTAEGISMPFMDALFTSISASCVTGLIVVDTATYFSLKGQFIIMLLIQLGGLNIISFATIFTIVSGKSLGIKHQSMLQQNLSTESLFSGKGLLKRIFLFSLAIEILGSLIIFLVWNPAIDFGSGMEKIFFSVFHSVSAFNNAGFSLFTNGLYENMVSNSFGIHAVIAVLIIFGGLGFPVLNDILSGGRNEHQKRFSWKRYSVNTKLVLYTTASLIVLGTLVFFFAEYNNALSGMTFMEKLMHSIFQSVTARTAGFNTVDFGSLTPGVIIFFTLLMYIGASPGSTGGGMKTSTFALLMLSANSTIRGKRNVEVWKKTINFEQINKAFSIFLFSAGAVFLGVFILMITEPHLDPLDLIFEEISAFATVGLTTGITTELSTAGRWVIMLSMFIGRLGTLTLAFSLSRKVKSIDYKYSSTHITVG